MQDNDTYLASAKHAEVFPLEHLANVLKSWLEVWAPGHLRVSVNDRKGFHDVKLAENADGYLWQPSPYGSDSGILTFGVTVYHDAEVPDGQFVIGVKPERYDEAVRWQRWRAQSDAR